MPATRPNRVCSRCRQSTPPGPCPRCTKQGRADADRRRPSAAARGYDHRWQQTRLAYLNEHPLCECDQHANTEVKPLAEEVHHLDGQGPLGPHGHCWHNLQALTHPCHSRITMREQGWHAQHPNHTTETKIQQGPCLLDDGEGSPDLWG